MKGKVLVFIIITVVIVWGGLLYKQSVEQNGQGEANINLLEPPAVSSDNYFLLKEGVREVIKGDEITPIVHIVENETSIINPIEVPEDEYVQDIAVLMYHHLLRKDENRLFQNNDSVISVENFEQQMMVLKNYGYNTLTLEELELFIKGQIKIPKKSVVITFDDGYLSNYIYAYPILKKHNFKASIFIISKIVPESPQEFNPDGLNYMSWEEINNSKDVFSYEGHTHDLHKLRNNTSYLVCEPEETVREDLRISKELLEAKYFAYPYGQYKSNTIEILKELDYKMAFTVVPGRVSQNTPLYEINRYGIYPATSIETFKRIVAIEE